MDCGRARRGGGLMQINRLRLVNFRQHEDTELEFGAGLTGIIGPNGAGKTTILEAIAWAMYGMPAARGSRDTHPPPRRAAPRAGRGRDGLRARRPPLPRRALAQRRRALSGRRRRPDRQQPRRGHRAGHPAPRHDPRGVLQHLLHRPEGARGHGGDDARRSGPSSSPACSATSGSARRRSGSRRSARRSAPGSRRCGRASAIPPSSTPRKRAPRERRGRRHARRRPRARSAWRRASERRLAEAAAPRGASCSSSGKRRSRSRRSSGWRTTRSRPRTQRVDAARDSRWPKPTRRGSRLAEVTAPARPAAGAPRGGAALDALAEAHRAAARGCVAQLDEVRQASRLGGGAHRRLPPATAVEAARLESDELRAAAHRRSRSTPRTPGPRGCATRRTPRPSGRGCSTSTRSCEEQRQRLVHGRARGRLSHLHPAARRRVRERARPARSPDRGGRLQRQLLQAADRAAPERAGRARRARPAHGDGGAGAVRGDRGAGPARGPGAGGGARSAEERTRLLARVDGAGGAPSAAAPAAYDEAATATSRREIRALEPLALEAERLRVRAASAPPRCARSWRPSRRERRRRDGARHGAADAS